VCCFLANVAKNDDFGCVLGIMRTTFEKISSQNTKTFCILSQIQCKIEI
jgi:hypothetical protein